MISIEDEYVEMEAGEHKCKVRIPTMEESDAYAAAYDSAKTLEDKNKELKKYLLGLGMSEHIFKKMRAKHFNMLLEEFKEKKD